MNCRTAIAVIDHNMSQNRPQIVDKQGRPVFKHQYSKGSSQWVQKAVYTPKVYQWVPVMMKMCVTQKENMLLPPVPVKPRGNVAPIPAPPRDEMMSNLISRFRKAYDSYVTTSPLWNFLFVLCNVNVNMNIYIERERYFNIVKNHLYQFARLPYFTHIHCKTFQTVSRFKFIRNITCIHIIMITVV